MIAIDGVEATGSGSDVRSIGSTEKMPRKKDAGEIV
jgi:hypothetical protein